MIQEKRKFKAIIKFSLNKEELKDKDDTTCFRKTLIQDEQC